MLPYSLCNAHAGHTTRNPHQVYFVLDGDLHRFIIATNYFYKSTLSFTGVILLNVYFYNSPIFSLDYMKALDRTINFTTCYIIMFSVLIVFVFINTFDSACSIYNTSCHITAIFCYSGYYCCAIACTHNLTFAYYSDFIV